MELVITAILIITVVKMLAVGVVLFARRSKLKAERKPSAEEINESVFGRKPVKPRYFDVNKVRIIEND